MHTRNEIAGCTVCCSDSQSRVALQQNEPTPKCTVYRNPREGCDCEAQFETTIVSVSLPQNRIRLCVCPMFMYYLEDSIIIQAIIIIVSSSSVLLGKLAEREILNQNKREEKICIEIL